VKLTCSIRQTDGELLAVVGDQASLRLGAGRIQSGDSSQTDRDHTV
jgi:hypothetical protein